MVCGCESCKRSNRIKVLMDFLKQSGRTDFMKLMEEINTELIHAEFDRDHYKSIIDGSWPNSDEMIKKYRGKCAH